MKKVIACFIIISFYVFVALTFAQTYPEGIISYWKFEEGSGSTAYDSVDDSVSHGTLHKGPQWTTGIVGGAISFDGMDDYVEGPRTQIEGGTYPTIGTVEAWVKLNSYPTTYRYGIVAGLTGTLEGQQGQNSCSFSEIIEVDPYKKASYYHWDGSSVRRPIGTTTLNLDQWYHLAATVKATGAGIQEVKLYVNGELEDSVMSNGYPAPGKYFDLSFANDCWGYHWSHEEFHGTIDEVAIYNRALTLEEIQQHYQNGLNGLGYEIVVPEISCTGFEPPMDKTISVKKKNRVLPLKMVCHDGDTDLTDLDIAPPVVEVDYVDSNGDPGAVEEVLYAGQGDEGNQFVYSDGYWRFNLQTKNFSAYGTYTIKAVSGDSDSYNIGIPHPEATFVIE